MDTTAGPGTIIDERYRLERSLGHGSYAEVFQARDQKNGAAVAVKVMSRKLLQDAEAMQRFKREASIQELLDHRNVAKLLNAGITPMGQPYLVVELLPGASLRKVLRTHTRIAPARAVSYCWQALQGLAACHTEGILHRDLKPANMMLVPSDQPLDRVVLIDFGFAAFEGSERITARGHVVGSLTYISPERLRGEYGDERSDLYAMGVTLFELIAGRAPFEAPNDLGLINAHLEAPPPPLEVIAPDTDIPLDLTFAIEKALEKEPEERYETAREMAAALEQAIRGSDLRR